MPGVNGYRDHYGPGYGYGDDDPYGRRDAMYERRQDGYQEDPYSSGYNRHLEDHRNGAEFHRGPIDSYRDDPPDPVYSHVTRGRPTSNGGVAQRGYSADTGGRMGRIDLDHLATFTVNSKKGLMYPEDGIRKLREMEMSQGIWTMRVQLLIDSRDIVVLDRQTEEVMERFPLSMVTDPTAVTNDDRRDIYNNIVLFTVLEDNYKHGPSEMHIFQCVSHRSQDIVDHIKDMKTVRSRSPPPSAAYGRPSSHAQLRMQEYEEAAQRAATAAAAYQPGPNIGIAFRQSFRPNHETSSVITETTDRDVQLLNHCFDDIERFVGRLQHAAESFRELDRRRRGRDERRHGRQGPGDGMLSMRARPPPAKDFIDTFQKFKLAFNLLAKLRKHIHDPNAPELIHFLLTPLSLVVEASKDPANGTPDLASKVVSPLLTAESKALLLNCLTSKEADLWLSLGDAWTVSRDQWKGYVPAYIPRFMDGWEPSPSWFNNGDAHSVHSAEALATHQRAGYDRLPERIADRPPPPRVSSSDRIFNNPLFEAEDPYSYDRRPRSPGPTRPRSPGPTRPRSPVPVRPRSPGPGRPHSPGPVRSVSPAPRVRSPPPLRDMPPEPRSNAYTRSSGGGRRSEERYPSAQRPAPSNGWQEEQRAFLNELKSKGVRACETIREREGSNAKELSVKEGEVFEVIDDSRNWWKLANSKGAVGHVPYTIVEVIPGTGGSAVRQ